MSLDIYLEGIEEFITDCTCDCCGNEHKRYSFPEHERLNITHNLTEMADACKLYYCVWRPEECNIKTAKQMIAPLREGLILLHENPKIFKKFEPENGWGTYEGFVKFIEKYLQACITYPQAKIRVSR